ncbi:interferon-induced protein with tetratricopeptide repeats 2-like [Osmerus mordax]|uniref:interferon-induced protein with tetratricopeptide repeats 2-like n=1 Tax=Osmerus mordax TaxID=8014 RepID=UPI00350F5A99
MLPRTGGRGVGGSSGLIGHTWTRGLRLQVGYLFQGWVWRFDLSYTPEEDLATEPPLDLATEPPLDLATEPPLDLATEPPLDLATEPPLDLATDPPLDVSTDTPGLPPPEAPCPFVHPLVVRVSTPKTALRLKLKKLECHFTWGITGSISKLRWLRDHLEDINTDEGYTWLGHIYNLLGFIRYRQGCTDSAVQYLRKAGETFLQINNTVSEEGPWLLVNYGNLAWMNFHLNNMKASQDYLEKVEAVLRDHPSPSQEDPLHPEVYAEKAWTLMKFGKAKMANVIECFQKAIAMEPDRKEWQTSLVLALNARCTPKMELEILEKLRMAKEVDPENSYLASVYLLRLAKKQRVGQDEIQALARRILSRPCGANSGLAPLLEVYRICLTQDEAMDLVQEALDRYPDDRNLKAKLAEFYKRKVFSKEGIHCTKSFIDRGISLFQEVIALYPESCTKAKLDLASIYAKSGRDGADVIYEELLGRSDLGPDELQMLHFSYAKHLNYYGRGQDWRDRSINHHMKVVEIQKQSKFQSKSVMILSRIVERGLNYRCAEIRDFLEENSATL